jgi:hypothetical protein
VHAMVAGKTVTEYQRNGIAEQIRTVWANIEAMVQSK